MLRLFVLGYENYRAMYQLKGAIEIEDFVTTEFSFDVSSFISGVAETNFIRQMKIVEIVKAIVQASPPSMP